MLHLRTNGPRVPAGLVLLAALAPVLLSGACSNGSAAPREEPFDAARAWTHLERIVAIGPRPAGSSGAEATRVYLESELRAIGLVPVRETFKAQTPAGEIEFANVYADLAAAAPGAQTVLLCTHFDTKIVPGPDGEKFVGANDGGSGTAVLLELARVIAGTGARALNYRFLFLDGEEAVRWEWEGLDNTYGSRHHAAELARTGQANNVRACILLDMVGDKDLRFFRDSYSDRRLNDIFSAAAHAIGLGAHVDGRREPVKDDHLSFMEVRIPSIDLIDLDFGPHNSWWHTTQDTLANCSIDSLRATGRIVLAALPAVETSFKRNP